MNILNLLKIPFKALNWLFYIFVSFFALFCIDFAINRWVGYGKEIKPLRDSVASISSNMLGRSTPYVQSFEKKLKEGKKQIDGKGGGLWAFFYKSVKPNFDDGVMRWLVSQVAGIAHITYYAFILYIFKKLYSFAYNKF